MRGAALATRGFFLLAGVGTATWAPMVPLAKGRLGLDEARLGLVLLCMGIGSVCSMPAAGFLNQRYGSRTVMMVSAVLVCLVLPALSVAPSALALSAMLAVFGGGMGLLDVSMNAHAVEVERLHGRPLMSGFHSLYSLGGLLGSAGMSALLGAGIAAVACAGAVAVLLLGVIVSLRGELLRHVVDPGTPAPARWARPSGRALALGALCLVVFLVEGAMLDWSAVFLRSDRGLAVASAGLGYAAFSIAMTAGRLFGDRITAGLGTRRVVAYGSSLAGAGLLIATALPWPGAALVGFILVGLGASNIVPVLFSAAGRLPATSVGVAIATVTALGYAGMLAGPAVIGLVASASSLPIALAGLAGLLLLVAISAPVVVARGERAADR